MLVADFAHDFLENIFAVINPEVPAELVHDDRDVGGRSLKVAELIVERLVSGTNAAGRMSVCQRMAGSRVPSQWHEVLSRKTTPPTLSGEPSRTGNRECWLWRNASRTSSVDAETSTPFMSRRGVMTSTTVVSASVKTPRSMSRCANHPDRVASGRGVWTRACKRDRPRRAARAGGPNGASVRRGERQRGVGQLRGNPGHTARQGVADDEEEQRTDD